MTDFNAADRDVSRAIRSWLREDRHEDASRIAGAVLDRVEATQGRRATWWPVRRTPIMNRLVTIGLGVAAVVVVGLLLSTQLLGSPTGGQGAGPTATATPEPTLRPTARGGLEEGPYVISDDEVRITVNIASAGWMQYTDFEAVYKDDDSLDPPESVGAALIAWAWPAGTGFHVYGDPCQWLSTIPETVATTPDEIAAAFAAQASTEATAPADVSVGGYAGKRITLRVPMSYYIDEDGTREEEFSDCDSDSFAFYGTDAGEDSAVERNAQGPGQIDELWILDVEGSIVILDAAYSPATPVHVVDELQALIESATFEVP